MNAQTRTVAAGSNRPAIITSEDLARDFKHVDEAIAALEGEAAEVPPVIEDDDDLAQAAAIIAKLGKCGRRCEEVRVDTNAPYLAATKMINDHFTRGFIARVAIAKTKLEKVTTTYLRAKARREQERRDAEAAEARRKAEEAQREAAEAVKAGELQAASTACATSTALSEAAERATSAATAPTTSMATTRTDGGTAGLVDHWTFEDLNMSEIDLETLRPFIPQTAIEQALRAYIKAGRREIKGARIFNDSKARVRA